MNVKRWTKFGRSALKTQEKERPLDLRELDLEVAEDILGWTDIDVCEAEAKEVGWDLDGVKPTDLERRRLIPRFTTNVSHSLEVVDYLIKLGWRFALTMENGSARAAFTRDRIFCFAENSLPSLAIIKAALHANNS